jgi:hypothetical protein
VIPHLAGFQGVVFASASQLNICRHWGVKPEFVVVIDSRDSVSPQIQGYMDIRAILLTHPGVSPKVLDSWGNRVAFFNLSFEGEWSEMQAKVYPWIRSAIQPFGCVVTASIQLADLLGCSPIILAGVDFAIVEGRNRATDYRGNGYEIDEELPPDLRPHELHAPEMQFYHTMLLALWKTKKYHLFEVEPHPEALLRELPQVKIENLGAVPRGYLDGKDIDEIVDRSLERVNVYVRAPVDGYAQIEYREPVAKQPRKKKS